MPKPMGLRTKAPPPSVDTPVESQAPPPTPPPEVETPILPPHIITNLREKIEPAPIDQAKVFKMKKKVKWAKFNALIFLEHGEEKKPVPKHPISLSWWPNELCFRLENNAVTKRLCVSNRSPKIMYIHCCGLWDDTARLGASWRCFPRTRILLAPGLVAPLFIKAKPREESPVQYAFAGLQLATAHLKDTVFGYFVVPIAVFFGNYTSPPLEEEDEIEEEK